MKNIKRYSGVLVKCNNQVLMCKRSGSVDYPGAWSIPAGKLDDKESPAKGARREFFEETNLKLTTDLKLCGFINRKSRDGKRDKGLMYVFLYEVNEKIYPDLLNAKDGEEHTECGYFDIQNLPIEEEKDQLLILIKNILSKS